MQKFDRMKVEYVITIQPHIKGLFSTTYVDESGIMCIERRAELNDLPRCTLRIFYKDFHMDMKHGDRMYNSMQWEYLGTRFRLNRVYNDGKVLYFLICNPIANRIPVPPAQEKRGFPCFHDRKHHELLVEKARILKLHQ